MHIQVTYLAVISAVLCVSVASAELVDLTASGQGLSHHTNVGLSWIALDTDGFTTDMTLTARYQIDPSSPMDLFASGLQGSIIFTNDGAGVQGFNGGGSSGISGGGGNQNEELILTFDVVAAGDSITLDFSKIKLGSGLDDKDDPIIWVYYNNTIAMFNETNWGSAYTNLGGEFGSLDFALLGFTSTDMVSKVVVRETHSHIWLSGVSFQTIPAPGVLAIFAGAGLFGSRRRREG